MQHVISRLAGERGTAVVEFAIVLPVLAMILFGIVDFGRVLNYWNDENQMAADGARWAAVNYQPAGGQSLKDFILSQADTSELRNGNGGSGNGVVSKVQVSITTTGTGKVGDPVKVCVTSTFHPFAILGSKIGDITTHGSATMRLEQTPTNFSFDPVDLCA